MTATAEQGAHIQQLKIACWSNMALCTIKLGTNPERAISYCDKVLAEDKAHSKARFRKAQALAQAKDFERALALLTQLAKEEPKNASVRAQFRQTVALKKEFDAAAKANQKKVFGNIFNRDGAGLY